LTREGYILKFFDMDDQTAGGAPVLRPLRWGILVYEVFRLAVFIRVMAGESLGDKFPGLAFGAANALFPLMALFLVVDFGRYAPYASLYAAGKILAATVLISCGFLWRDRIFEALFTGKAAVVGDLLTVALGDLVSAGGGIVLALRSPRIKAAAAVENGGL
jgi:hypothetical protein